MEPKCKLKLFSSFSQSTDSRKYLKHEKDFFLVQKYRHLHHLSLQLTHLCDNIWNKEVSLLCFVKFVTLILFQC